MKKLFYSLFALTLSVMTFTSCEDVPAPYDLPEESGGSPSTPTVDPKGTGTVEDPFNVAATLQYIKALEADQETTEDIYIEGIVESVGEEYSSNFGNATFYISDDGSSTGRFYVYRCLYLGNKEYKSGDNIKEGDKVIICGKVVNYKGSTPETVQKKAYLYSLNGVTGSGGGDTPEPAGDPKGKGTLDDPFNSIAANNYTSALAADKESTDDVYIKGKIAKIANNGEFSEQYGNASFYISDDGKDAGSFYVFRTLYLGNRQWVNGDKQIKVGDEVIICGKVVNYRGNTPETSQNHSYIYSLNGETDGGGGTPDQPTESQTTKDKPYSVSEALDVISKLDQGKSTNTEEYVAGKISQIDEVSTQYGNATYFITDGTRDLKIYRGKYLNGDSFTSENQINVGDDVIIYGKLLRYLDNKTGVETPEMAQGNYIVSLNNTTPDPGPQSEYPTSGDNGTFEVWESNAPLNWTTETTAGNAKLEMSTDAHQGDRSVRVKGGSQNQRLAYKELTLKPGHYDMSFWVKAATEEGGAVRPGYVDINVAEKKTGTYNYNPDYVNDLTQEWIQVHHEFTITEEGVYSVVIMNSKNPGKDVLIDDFILMLGNTAIIQ